MTNTYDNMTLDELRELAMFDPDAKRALEARDDAESRPDAADAGAAEAPDLLQDYLSGAYKHRSLHDLAAASRSGDDYAGLEYHERVLSESTHRAEQDMALRELSILLDRFSLAYTDDRPELKQILRHINLTLGYGYEKQAGGDLRSEEAHKAFLCFQNAYEKDHSCCQPLIRCYEQGIGVEVSVEKALKLREEAAERGGIESRMQIGALYLEQDQRFKAREWLQYALEAQDSADDPGAATACRYLLECLGGRPSVSADALLRDPTVDAWGYYAYSMTPGLSEGAIENALARGASCPESFAQALCEQKWTDLKTAQEVRIWEEEQARQQQIWEAEQCAREAEQRAKAEAAQAAEKKKEGWAIFFGLLIYALPILLPLLIWLGVTVSKSIHELSVKPLTRLIEAGDYVWDHTFSNQEMLRGKMTITEDSGEMTLHVDFYPYQPDASPVLQWDGEIVRAEDEDSDYVAYAELTASNGDDTDVYLRQDGDAIEFCYDTYDRDDTFTVYRAGSDAQAAQVPELQSRSDDLMMLLADDPPPEDIAVDTSMSPQVIRLSDGSSHPTGFFNTNSNAFDETMTFRLDGRYTRLSFRLAPLYGSDKGDIAGTAIRVYGDETELKDRDSSDDIDVYDVTGVQTLTIQICYGGEAIFTMREWAVVDPIIT